MEEKLNKSCCGCCNGKTTFQSCFLIKMEIEDTEIVVEQEKNSQS